MNPVPDSTEAWMAEILVALDFAHKVIGGVTDINDQRLQRLYLTAPPIAIQKREALLENHSDAVEFAVQGIAELHEQYPDFKLKPNRCFVYAYLDTLIAMKMVDKLVCRDVVQHLQKEAVIEA